MYLFRLDDACPTMNFARWKRVEDIFDRYGIKPLIGIIPANKDVKQCIDVDNPAFWDIALAWQNKGWTIALHGFDHCYISDASGINPLWDRSEFAGVPLEKQKQKISDGVNILKSHGLDVNYFFAPSHTFDENTLIALKECSDIRIISDTIGLNPYRKGDFVFIPQVGGHCYNSPFPGYYTFCFHPSVMKAKDFENLENFVKANKDSCISFKDIDISEVGSKGLLSKTLSFLYFQLRRFRK